MGRGCFFYRKWKVCLTCIIVYVMIVMESKLYKKKRWKRRDILKNRIEAIRKERGILQDEFAKSMGVSRQTISSLENGRYNPSILLAFKIARYFDMNIEDIFIYEEDAQ